MKLKITLFLILIFTVFSPLKAEQTDEFKKLFESYTTRYNFYSIPDTLYRIQTEFTLPKNFSHVDPPDTTSYSFWISNFPIWHQYKPVGNWKGKKYLTYEEVSRVVHLPWTGPSFKDVAIPIRLYGEFFFQIHNRFALKIYPKKGEILSYEKWLNGSPVYNHRGELFFNDDLQKEDTEKEYYKFLIFSMQNVNYQSIAKSCDSVASTDVQAGDMYIATDSTGKKGQLFIILHLIANQDGATMYLVANGCPDACDFHIQKFNEDRDNPWITIEQLLERTKEFDVANFYRYKSIENNNNE